VIFRRALVLAAAVLTLTGCGSGEATSVLSRTASSLDKIKSGTLAFDLLVTPRGGQGGPPFGFKLAGPFATTGSTLPRTRVRYTQIANGKSETVTLVSTGAKGFITVDGKTYELPASRLAPLRSATAVFGGKGGSLPLDDWIRDAEVSDGGDVGGADTEHVHGNLDISRAVADLGSLASSAPALNERERKQLEDSTRKATIDVWSGKEDHLLRKLVIDVDLGLEVPADLRAALGNLVGARLQLTLAVSNPNRPVTVRAPASAPPYPG
jgi:hypothetical protein